MPKTVVFTWVKNVYNLWKTKGIKSDKLPTSPIHSNHLSYSPVHKPQVIPAFTQTFTLYLSTIKTINFNLLIAYLYPLSTVPIITKTKEN